MLTSGERDLSWNLPYWARLLGYKLNGDYGTFGTSYLSRQDRIIKYWNYNETLNIIEMEEYLKTLEENRQ